jgi:hypothetical protein
MQVSISSNIKEVQRSLSRFEKKAMPKAVTRSINEVARKVFTQAKREVANEMGIVQKHIKSSFWLRRATTKRQIAEVITKGQPIKLIAFKNTRALKLGVKSKAYGESKFYKGAFITTVGKGAHKGVFAKQRNKLGDYRQRKIHSGLGRIKSGPNQGRAYAKALPIKELYGPSAPVTMMDRRIQRLIQQQIKNNFPVYLRRNLTFYVSKL